MKIHEEINAGYELQKTVQEEMKDERKTWKIEQKKEQESLQKIIEDQEFEKKNLAKEVIKEIKLNENENLAR